jgi:dUTP pyrophosphatase
MTKGCDPFILAPSRAHDTDAGADLKTTVPFVVPAHDSVEIGTGVHIQLPQNTCGLLVSKSGLNVRNCITSTGLIDQGYTGEIRVRIYNHGNYDYTFEAGDKVTQLCVSAVCYPTYKQVDEIRGGARGDAGYGSTGRR